MAAIRRTPTRSNGGSDVGVAYTNAVDDEIEAIWRYIGSPLTSVSGSANAVSATSDTTVVAAIAAYAKGQKFTITPALDNTSAVTLAIDSLSAVSVKNADGTALVAGQWPAGVMLQVEHDGTNFRKTHDDNSIVLNNTAGGGDGTTSPHAINSITVGNYNQSSYGLYVQRTLDAGSWIHPQTAITTLATVSHDPSGTSSVNDVVSLQSFARGAANVSLANTVNLFGGNDYTDVVGTGYQYALGREIDVGIGSGGSAVRKYGLHVVSFGPTRGSDHTDVALNIAKYDGSASAWDFGVSWGTDAFRSTSYIMGSASSTNALAGVDFTNVTFDSSGHAFKSPGFKVSSVGNLILGDQSTQGVAFFAASSAPTQLAGADLTIGGLHSSYAWLQSWNASPLYLNPLGNPVYVGGISGGNGSLNVKGGTLTVAATTPPVLGSNTAYTGSPVGWSYLTLPVDAGGAGVYYPGFLINVSSDIMDGGSGFVNAATINHNCGGSTIFGGRQALLSRITFTAATNALNSNRNYVGAELAATASAPDNGTNTGAGAKGALFGFSSVAALESGAINWLNLTGGEINITAKTGSTVRYKSGLQIAALPNDAISGSVYDCVLALSAQTGGIGADHAVLVGDMNGLAPAKTTGTLFGTTGTWTVGYGVDLGTVNTYTNFAWRSPGSSINGSGLGTFAGATLTTALPLTLQNSGNTHRFAINCTGTELDISYDGGAASVAIDNAGGIHTAALFYAQGSQVVGPRVTGYAVMTGTPNKAATYDTASVTLPQLAGRMMQLQADLTTHGLIGA